MDGRIEEWLCAQRGMRKTTVSANVLAGPQYGPCSFQDVMICMRSWQRGRPSFMVIFDLRRVYFLHIIYTQLFLVRGFGIYGIMIIISLSFCQIFDRQHGFTPLWFNISAAKHLDFHPATSTTNRRPGANRV